MVAPGRYGTPAEVADAEERWWQAHSWRFGQWEFRPTVGEVWYDGDVIILTFRETDTLKAIIDAWPEWVNKLDKQVVMRVRRKVGPALIQSSRKGYRFRPQEVMPW